MAYLITPNPFTTLASRQQTSAPRTLRYFPLSGREVLSCPGARQITLPVNVSALLDQARERLLDHLDNYIDCALKLEKPVFTVNLARLERELAQSQQTVTASGTKSAKPAAPASTASPGCAATTTSCPDSTGAGAKAGSVSSGVRRSARVATADHDALPVPSAALIASALFRPKAAKTHAAAVNSEAPPTEAISMRTATSATTSSAAARSDASAPAGPVGLAASANSAVSVASAASAATAAFPAQILHSYDDDLQHAFICKPWPVPLPKSSPLLWPRRSLRPWDLPALQLNPIPKAEEVQFKKLTSAASARAEFRRHGARFFGEYGFKSGDLLFEQSHETTMRQLQNSLSAARASQPQPAQWLVPGFNMVGGENDYHSLWALLMMTNLYSVCVHTAQNYLRDRSCGRSCRSRKARLSRLSTTVRSITDCRSLYLTDLPKDLSCIIIFGVWHELELLLRRLGLWQDEWVYPEFRTFARLLRMLHESRFATDARGCLVRIARCVRCDAAHFEFINTNPQSTPTTQSGWNYDEEHGGYRYLKHSNVCPVCGCPESIYLEPNPHDEELYRDY